jgi:hypothetical protein
LVRGVLIDEIIFENIKKVNKNNHEGVKMLHHIETKMEIKIRTR